MHKADLGDVATWCWLYLAAKSSHVGVDVDGLSCPLHRRMHVVIRRGDKASCQALPCPSCCNGRWHLSEGCEAPRLRYSMEC
jgi:hypothetical protein